MHLHGKLRVLTDIAKLIASLSPGTLIAFVLLAAFALAAYAIYAVLSVTKGKR